MPRCVHCASKTHSGFASDVYTRRGMDLEVSVTGIPAEVCPTCGESYVDVLTAKEVERIITPLFDAARHLVQLCAPKITVAFPAPELAEHV